MNKKIIRREVGQQDVLAHLPPLLQRIYAARSVISTKMLDREITCLLPPDSLLGLNKAVNLLAAAIMKNERILIVGDFDADGATSTALCMRAMRAFGAKQINFMVPNRFAFGYGLTPELVAATGDYQPELIITVDNGIANHAGVLACRERGIKVVITDHHLSASTLPEADAIVNPNQPNDPFPSKNLAGVGVIFYVMLALRRHLLTEHDWFQKQNLPVPNMSHFLDLVALGTVADLVPLDHNNRVLVHQGLKRIRAGVCVPGIPALLELSDKVLTRTQAADLGFAVAARLNAAGRLDDMTLGINCLLSDDSFTAREFARSLDKLNTERKSIEQEMQFQALHHMQKLLSTLQGELPAALCLYDETWHQGVIGILASRIKDRFHRPVIVFAPGQAGELKGSARSIAGLHIRDALAQVSALHPELLNKFGGHAMAAGLSISAHLLKDFVKIFDEVVSAQLSENQLQHVLLSDGELAISELNLETAVLLRDAGPWGQAFPEPLFDDVFEILEQRIVGDKHLKLRFKKGDKVLEAVAFFVDLDCWPNHRCQRVRAAFRLDINEYKGRSSVQLIVEHLEALH